MPTLFQMVIHQLEMVKWLEIRTIKEILGEFYHNTGIHLEHTNQIFKA